MSRDSPAAKFAGVYEYKHLSSSKEFVPVKSARDYLKKPPQSRPLIAAQLGQLYARTQFNIHQDFL